VRPEGSAGPTNSSGKAAGSAKPADELLFLLPPDPGVEAYVSSIPAVGLVRPDLYDVEKYRDRRILGRARAGTPGKEVTKEAAERL